MNKTSATLLLAALFIGAIIFAGQGFFDDKEVREEDALDKTIRKYRRRTPRVSDYRIKPALVKAKQVVESTSKTLETHEDDDLLDKEKSLMPSGQGGIAPTNVPSMEELEEMDEYFDQLENSWDGAMKELLIGELGMSEENFEEYVRLREAYYEEKVDAFDDYQDAITNGTMSYQEVSQQISEQLRGKYERRLEGVIGPDNMHRFREIRRQFNQELDDTYGNKHRGIIAIDI